MKVGGRVGPRQRHVPSAQMHADHKKQIGVHVVVVFKQALESATTTRAARKRRNATSMESGRFLMLLIASEKMPEMPIVTLKRYPI